MPLDCEKGNRSVSKRALSPQLTVESADSECTSGEHSKRAKLAHGSMEALSSGSKHHNETNNRAGKNGFSTSTTQAKKPTSVKKLTIKNLKTDGRLPESYCAVAKSRLEAAVHAVHKCTPVNASLEELYRAVEDLCNSGHSKELYDTLRHLCHAHLKSSLPSVLEASGTASASNSPSPCLQLVDHLWKQHCEQMIMIRSVFLYLDRTYTLHSSMLPSIWDCGLDLFRQTFMCEPAIERKVIDGMLALIEAERRGEQVDRTLLRSLTKMLTSLQIYQQSFEKKLLKATNQLFAEQGATLSNEMEVPDYLRLVDKRLADEYDRIESYLDPSTSKALISAVEKHLIGECASHLLAKGLHQLLADDRKTELKLCYALFGRVKTGHELMRQEFSEYIKKTGKALVMDTEKEKSLVSDLMSFKSQCDDTVKACFESNERMDVSVRDAFDWFINQRQNKPAELVAKFMDSKLRAGNKESTEQELDKIMDKLIVLFRFIHGKDVFEAFYKKDLAKRLLLGRSASVDAEKAMLSKLKAECGAGFTSKLEGMFKDMELSKDLNGPFKQYITTNATSLSWPNIDMSVSILTMGHWPSYTPMDVVLPPQMAEYHEVFTKFYLGKHAGRKLHWQHSLGQCLLRAQFKPLAKELIVSQFQALILLLFNERDTLSFEEIKQGTNIEDSELRRTLQSLACGKLRPINKEPKSKDINDDDKFSFNLGCSDKLFRIRISQVQMKETEQEQAATEEQVFQDRQYEIDAAVVRIMKARKHLAHQLLMAELFKQLRFPAKANDLKKRIESLIDRDYLSRDKEESTLYHYVA